MMAMCCFQMKEVLGIEPMDTKETVIDMAYSLIETGFIKKTKKYKGPGGIEVSVYICTHHCRAKRLASVLHQNMAGGDGRCKTPPPPNSTPPSPLPPLSLCVPLVQEIVFAVHCNHGWHHSETPSFGTEESFHYNADRWSVCVHVHVHTNVCVCVCVRAFMLA